MPSAGTSGVYAKTSELKSQKGRHTVSHTNQSKKQGPYKCLFILTFVILIFTIIGFAVGYMHCDVGYTGHGSRSGYLIAEY